MEQQKADSTQEVDKTKAAAAKGAATDTTEDKGSDDQDLGFTDAQKAYIESLRKENAKYRTKSKELETQYSSVNERFSKLETGLKSLFGEGSEKLSPEEQVGALSQQNEQLVLNNALNEAAIEYGIGKEDYSYFKFLVQERLQSLNEGEELTEEDLDGIAKSARRKTASSSTSVEDGSPAPEDASGVSLEQFSAMGINEKSILFAKSPEIYKQLLALERKGKTK
jgi:hypothetical protein